MSTRFDLDDKEWALIEPLLPTISSLSRFGFVIKSSP